MGSGSDEEMVSVGLHVKNKPAYQDRTGFSLESSFPSHG